MFRGPIARQRALPLRRCQAISPAGRTCIPSIPRRVSKRAIFRYQPLGCPITHFARVLKNDRGIVTVHLVGPVHLLHGRPVPGDIGICLVAAFEGTVSRGKRPEVGEMVRFLPELLHDAKVLLGSGGALRGGDGADRGDRSEGW